jgi:hypothetical protein
VRRQTRTIPRAAGAALIGVLALTPALALAGCAGGTTSTPTPSGTPESLAQLCDDPLVADCATQGRESVAVTIIGSATDEETLALAGRVRDAAAAESLPGEAILQREPVEVPQLDAEITPPPAWTLQVYPADAAEIEQTLTDVLEVAGTPGTTGISIADGWPTVTIIDMAEFEWTFTSIKDLDLFADGGTYTLQSVDERLRIVHVPARTADAAIHEVVRIAQEYPHAEVVLEAEPRPDASPTLYVSGLEPDEVEQISDRLTDPALADVAPEGALSFVLGTTGEGGVTYTGGTFGGVPID